MLFNNSNNNSILFFPEINNNNNSSIKFNSSKNVKPFIKVTSFNNEGTEKEINQENFDLNKKPKLSSSNIQLIRSILKQRQNNQNSGTFLTDKIKENNINNLNEEENKENDSIKYEKNETVPIDFDKLIINLNENPNQPKPIDPLFFIINGEKPIEKENFLNFNTNKKLYHNHKTSHNLLNINKNEFFSRMENNLKDLYEKNLFNKTHHNFLQSKNFEGCSNKIAENKIKIRSDIKKIIFNNNDNYENNVNVIKKLIKSEMVHRSAGHGVFLFNNNFKQENRKLWLIKNQNFLDEQKNNFSLNLRKKKFFDDNKKMNDAEIFFSRTYMKLTYDDYKKIQNEKKDLKKQNFILNNKIEKIYNNSKQKNYVNIDKIINDQKLNNILKHAQMPNLKPDKKLLEDFSNNYNYKNKDKNYSIQINKNILIENN